jgi:hypothetical protein
LKNEQCKLLNSQTSNHGTLWISELKLKSMDHFKLSLNWWATSVKISQVLKLKFLNLDNQHRTGKCSKLYIIFDVSMQWQFYFETENTNEGNLPNWKC